LLCRFFEVTAPFIIYLLMLGHSTAQVLVGVVVRQVPVHIGLLAVLDWLLVVIAILVRSLLIILVVRGILFLGCRIITTIHVLIGLIIFFISLGQDGIGLSEGCGGGVDSGSLIAWLLVVLLMLLIIIVVTVSFVFLVV
jgi:hypothetical protein